MEDKSFSHTNHLINESSPYLLQHAHNPVNWYPWGEIALQKARQENRLLIISIGYSACHWCHVMEHESFENKEVAEFMNENFIAVKVDREERPDIDQVYMNAIQLLSGRGGWPLNCIALPDGRPIYGGTYYPADQWLDMLKQVLAFVNSHPEETEEQARKLTEGIQSQENIYTSKVETDFSTEDLHLIFNNWKHQFDKKNGGSSGAPKFPLPSGLNFLLFYHYLSKNEEALKAVTTTLRKMAGGGIYDQVGGGFARYSTDEKWKVPHFEKMLYDNAQLISLYSKAFQATGDQTFKEVISESVRFIEREMTSPEGGFYSALDADSEGVEGKYYVWRMDEIRPILDENAEMVAEYFKVTEKGNWEDGNNILHHEDNIDQLLMKYKVPEASFKSVLKTSKKKLLLEREQRVRPGRDEKILTSWNALMISGYVDAYNALNEKVFLEKALRNAEFLGNYMIRKDHSILRNFKDGKATISGFLDDYAFTISAFISLYQATFNEQWLLSSYKLCEYTIAHFYDPVSGMFFYTSDLDPALIARKMEVADNVIPSASSEMAKNLYILGKYLDNDDFTRKSVLMVRNVKTHALTGGPYYSNWNFLIAWLANDLFEVAITGADYGRIKMEFGKYYLPDILYSGGNTEGNLPLLKNRLIEGQTTIYVCRDKACQLPVTETREALRQIGIG